MINEDGSISIIHAANPERGVVEDNFADGESEFNKYSLVFRPRNDTPDGKKTARSSERGQIIDMESSTRIINRRFLEGIEEWLWRNHPNRF